MIDITKEELNVDVIPEVVEAILDCQLNKLGMVLFQTDRFVTIIHLFASSYWFRQALIRLLLI